MTKLSFKKRQLELDLYGKLVEVEFPDMGRMRKYQSDLAVEGVDEFATLIELLVSLGMSKEDVEKLEVPHMQAIVEALMGDKKK